MLPFRYVAVFAFLALAAAQQFEYEADPQPRPAPGRVQQGYSGSVKAAVTPVPILKQINRHNEDGSYTYGYEGADGSFKIETKLPTGEVKGKYGYVDDTGKLRVVEYGATKYGFEPAGEGITVAPPTLVDETTNKDGLLQENYADYEQPQPARARAPAPRPQYNPEPQQFAPAPVRSAPARAQPVSDFGFTPRSTPVRSFAPARPQASFNYASPAPAPIEEQTYEEPAPRPRVTYAQPRPQPQYQFAPANTQAIARPQPAPQQNYAPAPQPQQVYAPAPRAAPVGGRSGGVLDQLAKDYALPQGGAAPLHDISFGYY